MTADKAALLDLRDRLKAAPEGSFDLDKAILRALGFTWRGMDYWSADNKTMWHGLTNLSRSLDAAVGLVPEGFRWSVNGAGMTSAKAVAVLRDDLPLTDRAHVLKMAEAATPALALCLARIEYEIAKVTDHA